MANYIKKHKKQFLLIIYVLMFIIFILKPVCFDAKIYIEAAQRADKMGNFPNNIVEAWEHKYILNRLLFFIMVKIVKIFINESFVLWFEIFIKTLYGIIGVTIIKCFSKNTKSLFSKYEINEETVFGVLYFAIIGSGIYFSLQTEMTAFLITLIAIIFVLKEKMYHKIFSGFIISTLFWLKGVTILYSVIILAIMILCNHNKKDIISVISSSVIFLLIELLLMYSFYPNEIQTMYLATQYMTKQITLTGILRFLCGLICQSNIFACGVLAFIINTVYHIKLKNKKLLILEILVWFVLAIGVIIQKSPYVYTAGLMIVANLFSIFIFLHYKKEKSIIIITVMLLIAFILMHVLFEFYIGIETYNTTCDAVKKVETLNEKIPDLKNEKVLYIGNGLSSYYIKAGSYTNYTTTIFLSNYNTIYLNSEYINNIKNKIKEYTGKYIILDKNELKNKFRISDDIIEFILNNYRYKIETEICVYEYSDDSEENLYNIVIYEKIT